MANEPIKDARPVKVGLIGVSGFGNVHYNDLMREVDAGTMQPLAATIINQDEEREKCETLVALGAELFTDYEAMFAQFGGQMDLCFIPTGIHLHRPMTEAALRAGVNVYVEKPAAGAIQDVRAMMAAEREAGKFAAVGYQTMYTSEILLMKRAILEGEIGDLRAIKVRCLWPRPTSYYQRNGWAGRLKVRDTWVLDSIYNNAVAHQLNMITFLAGMEIEQAADIESVQAELYHAHAIESADTVSLRARTPQNVDLYFFGTHCPAGYLDPEIVARGTEGRIEWKLDGTTRVVRKDGEEVYQGEGNFGRERIAVALLDRLQGGDAFICTLDIASRQTLVVNGAHESSRIHAVPEAHIITPYEGNAERIVIAGVDDAINRGFEEEALFSELGVPWAVPGAVFPMAGYEAFNGGAEARA